MGKFWAAVVLLLAGAMCVEGGKKNNLEPRVSLLETNERALREDYECLLDRVQKLEETHAQDVETLLQFCNASKASLAQELEDLKNVQAYLLEKVEYLLNRPLPTTPPEVELEGPCSEGNYAVIDDYWRAFDLPRGNQLKCDSDLAHGWYRFLLNGANAVMPTECVDGQLMNVCGTHAGEWLDLQGQFMPAVGQEVDARACASWTSGCCQWESPITVRNCGNFYVYYLQPLTNVCSLAFCVKDQ